MYDRQYNMNWMFMLDVCCMYQINKLYQQQYLHIITILSLLV